MRPQKKSQILEWTSGLSLAGPVQNEVSRESPRKESSKPSCVARWQITSTNHHHLCCSPETLSLCGFKLETVNERSFQGIWKVHIKLRSLIIRSHESGKVSTLTWQFSRPPQRLPTPQHNSSAGPAMGSLFVIHSKTHWFLKLPQKLP